MDRNRPFSDHTALKKEGGAKGRRDEMEGKLTKFPPAVPELYWLVLPPTPLRPPRGGPDDEEVALEATDPEMGGG